jgi:hypothetical protein
MNINKYYETIKQKLEGIEPEFHENDWDEMKGFMALNNPKVSFWNSYGRMFLYSTGLLVLLTSLFFNIKQNHDYNTLLKINQSLSKHTIYQPEVIYHTDTIFVTKYITKWQTVEKVVYRNATQSNVKTDDESVVNNDNYPIKSDQNIVKSNANHDKIFNKYSNNQKITGNIQATTKLNNEIIDKSFNEQQFDKHDINVGSNIKLVDDNTSEIIKNEQGILSKPEIEKQRNAIKSVEQNFDLKTIKSIPFNPIALLWNGKQPNIVYSNTDLIKQRKHLTINLPSISLSNLKYKIGVSLDVANEQVGASVISEVLFSKHLSFNTGVRFLNITGSSYYTSEQYNLLTKRDFRQQYATFVPANYDIINLDFQNYLLQIPIGITYRYPLRNDFTLLFSAGTNLDLFVRQYVNFDYKEDNSKFEQGTYKSTLTNSLFNHIELSAGLEKTFKRMTFQLHPFISPQVKETAYRNEEFIFGAKMKFFVNLIK